MTVKQGILLAALLSGLLNLSIFAFPFSWLFWFAVPGFFVAANLGVQGVHGDPLVWQAHMVNFLVYFGIVYVTVSLKRGKQSPAS